ncbi:MAG: hypothetical protein QM751_12380 [Paludibacteraceae bacterium]
MDLNGMELSPIYDPDGNFLGTDDEGLQGKPIIMNRSDFEQGMSHEAAMAKDLAPNGGDEYYAAIPDLGDYYKFYNHFMSLKDRPDYDGFVTISEGIAWAKAHPNALKNPTPNNTLYIDAAKLNFGNLSTHNFPLKQDVKANVNLFNFVIWGNSTSMNTTYALGNTQMQLLDSSTGTVKLFKDEYNWDFHHPFKDGKPQGTRDNLIYWERKRARLNDSHGFPVIIYGTGTINTK